MHFCTQNALLTGKKCGKHGATFVRLPLGSTGAKLTDDDGYAHAIGPFDFELYSSLKSTNSSLKSTNSSGTTQPQYDKYI